MKPALIAALAAGLAFGGTALAADEKCALPYDVFEASVPHTDLEECPAKLKAEGRFCRLAVVAEVATVFIFDEGSGCLVQSVSFEEDQFKITLQ